MTAFLITSSQGISNWKNDFSEVQNEMNILEKKGIVSNVKVEYFEKNILKKSLTYDFNGQNWEKRK